MRIYLASRYSRREELCVYRVALNQLGFDVQARWLDGNHQLDNSGKPIGEQGEALVEGNGDLTEKNAVLRAKFALDDYEDVIGADAQVNFTEAPRSSANRGGRHVEFGIALALKKPVIVVGHRENIFHCLPQVQFAENFDAAILALTETRRLFGKSDFDGDEDEIERRGFVGPANGVEPREILFEL